MVQSGAFQFDYGTALFTNIVGGGQEGVEAGGIATSTTVQSGGLQSVYGIASGTVVESGGSLLIGAGGAVSGLVVSNGGSALVQSGGELSVLSGDTVVGVQDQWLVEVSSAGTAIGTVVSGDFAEQDVDDGAAINTVIRSGGAEVIFGTGLGTTTGTVVDSGGQQIVDAGTAISTVINDGGRQIGDETTIGTVVNSGGEQDVGGTDIGTVIESGGLQLDAGVASGTIVSAGGTAIPFWRHRDRRRRQQRWHSDHR